METTTASQQLWGTEFDKQFTKDMLRDLHKRATALIKRYERYSPRKSTDTTDDRVDTALMKLFEGARIWDPARVDLCGFLLGVIASDLTSELRRSALAPQISFEDRKRTREDDAAAVGRLMLGRYGGRVDGGASKNEDAALLIEGADWELAVVADAHAGGDSSALVVELLESSSELQRLLEQPSPTVLSALRTEVVERLLRADTSQLSGETAVLVVARKGVFVSWLSIGDCVAYALHPDLARLGQHALNQRSFYEWFGRVDSLRLDVPCHASGVHALRPGRTRIVLATDGLLEFGEKRYADGARLHADFYGADLGDGVRKLMQAVHDGGGVDSATVVAWDVTGGDMSIQPSR